MNPNPELKCFLTSWDEMKIGIQIKNIADESFMELSHERRAPGEYTLHWDDKDGSGVAVEKRYYFVEILAGIHAHKVLLQQR
jgi:flagellar hook assembly protein FlgD